MALTRILRLSTSPSLHHHGRALFTPNHIRLVVPVTINRDSKTCSKRLSGPSFRSFSSSPVVSDERMEISVAEDLINSVKYLRRDVEVLLTEVSLLNEAVFSMEKKCNALKNDGNNFENEKETAKKSDFSEAMATHKMSDFSEAMATHFNTRIVVSQDDKAAEKMSDVSEEMQKSDNQGKNENASQNTSSFFETQKSDTKEFNSETVSRGEKQDPLLEKVESEISRALDFQRASCQGVNFPDDFPFKVESDVPGFDSIYLKGRYKSQDIIVEAEKPSVFTSITAKNYEFQKSIDFRMPLLVDIHPADSEQSDIAFSCAAFGTGYSIEKVYGEASYDSNGLVFSELNDELQNEFKKYLEKRGITTSTTNVIFGYMLDKMNREKLGFLYKLKELLEAGKES